MVLAAAGAKVVVSDIVEGTGQATVDAVQRAGGAALFVKADLASEADVRALVERAVSAHGRLDGAFKQCGPGTMRNSTARIDHRTVGTGA